MITSSGNPNKVGGKPAPQSLEQKYHMKSPWERTRQLAVRGHHLTVLLYNQNRKICSTVLTSFTSQSLTRHTLHITKMETSNLYRYIQSTTHPRFKIAVSARPNAVGFSLPFTPETGNRSDSPKDVLYSVKRMWGKVQQSKYNKP